MGHMLSKYLTWVYYSFVGVIISFTDTNKYECDFSEVVCLHLE